MRLQTLLVIVAFLPACATESESPLMFEESAETNSVEQQSGLEVQSFQYLTSGAREIGEFCGQFGRDATIYGIHHIPAGTVNKLSFRTSGELQGNQSYTFEFHVSYANSKNLNGVEFTICNSIPEGESGEAFKNQLDVSCAPILKPSGPYFVKVELKTNPSDRKEVSLVDGKICASLE